MSSPFITRVTLRNFKNISYCDVALGPLTFLVGPNGSGKSNFIDALHFVKDAIQVSLDHAFRQRDGVLKVLPVFAAPGETLGIRLDFRLEHSRGYYAFLVQGTKGGGYTVDREECVLTSDTTFSAGSYFRVVRGQVDTNIVELIRLPEGTPHELAIRKAGSWSGQLEGLVNALLGMNFYNPQPEALRDLADMAEQADFLLGTGRNAASVLRRLARQNPEGVSRINEYLARIVPTVAEVRTTSVARRETAEFLGLGDGTRPLYAASMSTGTLRVLAILVSLFQTPATSDTPLTLTAIEEPEATVHPAAAGVLLDALKEASEFRQVIATSHSPDLLDDKHLDPSSILAVEVVDGESRIGSLDEVSASVLRDRLTTPGGLLRVGEMHPDASTPPPGSDSLFSER